MGLFHEFQTFLKLSLYLKDVHFGVHDAGIIGQSFLGDFKLSAAGRVFATNMAMKHTVEMVQVLGGYGISKEFTLEKYMRDAKLLQIMDATNEIITLKGAALL